MKSAGRTVCKKCNAIFQPILAKALKENKELREVGQKAINENSKLHKERESLHKENFRLGQVNKRVEKTSVEGWKTVDKLTAENRKFQAQSKPLSKSLSKQEEKN